jgi:hypothetical protein
MGLLSIRLVEFCGCEACSPDASLDYTVWINPKAVLMVRTNSEGYVNICLPERFVIVRESLSKVIARLQGEDST